MPHRSRAMLLDLDDTLYPHRRFRLSGFAAVARHVHAFHGVDERRLFRALVRASRGAHRGHELDLLVSRFAVNVPVADLVCVVRTHDPVLRLPLRTEVTLRELRRTWRLAIVTNGIPAIQARKVAALGVERLVDTVVYASDYGSGEGKPDREPFLEALRRLDVAPAQAIAVGDDDFTDVFGSARCGMRSIQTRQWRCPASTSTFVCATAHAVVNQIAEVPGVAEYVLPARLTCHAA
jgi:putative hydrolase of the HAD superfamily